MKNWKKNLICSNTDLAAVKINCGIFQGDSFLLLLFVVSILPLTLALYKMKQRCNFGKGKGKLNHLLFMDDLKLYGVSQPDIDSLIQTVYPAADDIVMRFGLITVGFNMEEQKLEFGN